MSEHRDLGASILERKSTLLLVLLLALIVRLIVGLNTLWIYHSDELFQYLEQAHRVYWGYGLVPWEYRFGTRSWIIPLINAGLLWGADMFGLSGPVAYIPFVRTFWMLFSLLLVYGSYGVGKSIGGRGAPILLAVGSAFWYELVLFSPTPTPEVIAMTLFVGAAGIMLSSEHKTARILAAVMLGVSLFVRIQNALAFVVLIWFVQKKVQDRKKIGIGVVIGFVLCGLVDWPTWGIPFYSLYANFKFNVGYNVARLWGEQPATYYITTLAIASGGIWFVLLFPRIVRGRSRVTLLIALATMIPHFLIAHKEYRFLFLATPWLLFSVLLVIIRLSQERFPSKLIAMALGLWLVMTSAAGFVGALPDQHKVFPFYATKKDPGLSAFLYLSEQTEVTGIMIEGLPWWESGGYYYLHHDIPVYWDRAVNQTPLAPELVSYIVCPTGTSVDAAYTKSAEFGNLEIWIRTLRVSGNKIVKAGDVPLLQPGIDGRHEPLNLSWP